MLYSAWTKANNESANCSTHSGNPAALGGHASPSRPDHYRSYISSIPVEAPTTSALTEEEGLCSLDTDEPVGILGITTEGAGGSVVVIEKGPVGRVEL